MIYFKKTFKINAIEMNNKYLWYMNKDENEARRSEYSYINHFYKNRDEGYRFYNVIY